MRQFLPSFCLLVCMLIVGAILTDASSSYGRVRPYRRQSHSRDRDDSASKSSIIELNRQIISLQQDVKKLQDAVDCPTVAFTAFTSEDSGPVAAGVAPIVFPFVGNYGGVYDINTGIFTVPVNGIYNVGVSISVFDVDPNSDFASVNLIRRRPGGVMFPIGIVTNSREDPSFDYSSADTVAYFEAGDEIFVRNNVATSFRSSSFRGFLVKEVTLGPEDIEEILQG